MFYHFQFVVVGESTGGVCKVRDSRAVEINNTTLLYTSTGKQINTFLDLFLMCFLLTLLTERK